MSVKYNYQQFNKSAQKYLGENSIRSAWELAGQKMNLRFLDLSLGNPIAFPPPKKLINRMKKVLQGANSKGFFAYMDNAGYAKTRNKIAKDLVKNNLFPKGLSQDNIVLTCGASAAMNCVLTAIANKNDEIMLLSPYFVDFPKYITNSSAKAKIVNLKPPHFDLDVDLIARAINNKTKAIIINTPNNPTGMVYSKDKILELIALLKLKNKQYGHPIYIISDEVYREFVFDKLDYFSPCQAYENTIMIYSYSKSLNIPGERIGYAAIHPNMPNGKVLFNLVKQANRILGFTNAPALIQKVIPEMLPLEYNIKYYQRQRDKLKDALEEGGFKFEVPKGAFYFFIKVPVNEAKFTQLLQKNALAVVLSQAFGIKGYFRIAFCLEPQIVNRACKRFIKIGKSLAF